MIFILIKKKKLLNVKSCGLRPNNARYEKMLKSKIVHIKEIYNFDFDHFLIKRAVFILIKKTLLKIKSCGFQPNNARLYEKILKSKIVHLKEIYNFDFDHFLIKQAVFILILKNVIKNQKFNFLTKLYGI